MPISELESKVYGGKCPRSVVDVCLEVGGGRGGVLGSGVWGEVPAGGDGQGSRVHHLDTTLCYLEYSLLYYYITFKIVELWVSYFSIT